MVYCDAFTMNPAAGFAQVAQYRLNSIFDPDLTATGHQPFLRDTYSTLYATYIVEKCVVEIDIMSNVPTYQVLRSCNATNVPTNITLEGERVDSHSMVTSTNNIRSYQHTYDIPHVLGIAPDQLYESDNQTAQGSNPAAPYGAYLNIMGQAINQTDSPLMYYRLKLTYKVLLTQLSQVQSQS